MRPSLVIFIAPSRDLLACVRQRQKPVGVQALFAEATVEALDVGIVRVVAGSGEVQGHAVGVGPQVEHLAGELGTIIDPDGLGDPTLLNEPFENRGDMLSFDTLVALDGQALSGEQVDHRQGSESLAVEQCVGYEVHRPAFVRRQRDRTLRPVDSALMPLGALIPERQTVLPVEPIDPLGVDVPALPTEQHGDAPVTLTHAGVSDLLNALPERRLVGAFGLVLVHRAMQLDYAANPPFSDTIVPTQFVGHHAELGGLHSFFERTS